MVHNWTRDRGHESVKVKRRGQDNKGDVAVDRFCRTRTQGELSWLDQLVNIALVGWT